MGYARLHFPNSGTVLMTHLLYDVVGVLTGTFTSTSQLQTATQSLSQIVNTANSNWSFVYPAAHGTKGTTNTSWVLSAPCVTAGKTKYIRLTGLGAGIVAGNGSSNYFTSSLGSSLDSGLLMQACSAASSATALTNPTWYNTGSSASYNNAFTGSFIYLHWSNRHCLIYGGVNTTVYKGFQATFEFQETGITTFRGVAPQVYINYTSVNGNWNTTATAPSNLSGTPNIVQVLNHFNVSTATATGLYNVLSDINSQQNDMPLCSDNISAGAYPSTTTKNSSGAVARQVQPLYWHQHHIGVPHQYISQLSNVYRTAPSMGQEGDTVTIGNDTYVYLPTEYNTYNLLVKRA